MKKTYQHSLELKVRDYECDIQGIVNNSVYQNYLEHARHEFILTKGLNFTQLHNKGIDMVVARIEMAFKTPLRGGDVFVCCTNVRKEGIKYVFEQDIYRKSDMNLSLKALVTTVGIVNGKLSKIPEVDEVFD